MGIYYTTTTTTTTTTTATTNNNNNNKPGQVFGHSEYTDRLDGPGFDFWQRQETVTVSATSKWAFGAYRTCPSVDTGDFISGSKAAGA
jgi:hypothetical protein